MTILADPSEHTPFTCPFYFYLPTFGESCCPFALPPSFFTLVLATFPCPSPSLSCVPSHTSSLTHALFHFVSPSLSLSPARIHSGIYFLLLPTTWPHVLAQYAWSS